MIRMIERHFIKNTDDVLNPEIRKKYGVLGGMVGIVCNIALFAIKFIAGLISGSIAIVSDAFNNLSDMGTALVSVAGSVMGGKGADKEHPYGHGRAEYISALIIAFLIILVGVELAENSIRGIINPDVAEMSVFTVCVLIVSVLAKLWMWYSYRYLGRRISSPILLASAKDSINDCVSTAVVLAAFAVDRYVDFPVDAVAGLCVSAMIMWSGIGVAKETIGRLIGRAPSEEMIDGIEKMIMTDEHILGMHDLRVHDYGPGIVIASVHAEVPCDLTTVEVHNIIDKIEHRILDELGVDIVIHMDPVSE